MPRSKNRKHKDEKERFYLLPGQGGKMYRQKQKKIIWSSVAAASFIAIIMVIIMYFTNRRNPFGH
ncbi:MAG TPA: hypothetical protein VGN23_10745 [Verrucomicrobiae bacterium]|jgi:ABC-type glycerol-3-phosphate transport system permease component